MSGLSASCRPASSRVALHRHRIEKHLRTASGRAGSRSWMVESPELQARRQLGRHARVITSPGHQRFCNKIVVDGKLAWQGSRLWAQRPGGCPREGADTPAAAGDVSRRRSASTWCCLNRSSVIKASRARRKSSWFPSAPARTMTISRTARAMTVARQGWREPAEMRRRRCLHCNGRGNCPGHLKSTAAKSRQQNRPGSYMCLPIELIST